MALQVADLIAKLSLDAASFQSGLKSIEATTDRLAGRMKSFGAAMSLGVTIPLTVIGGAALKAGKDLDDALDRIRTGTGATGAALKTLERDFTAVFKAVPQSAKEVSTAIADLNTRLGLTGEPLQNLSKQVLNLARITESDLGETIRGATRVFGDWSVATKDQGATLDTLFKVSQTTGIELSKLQQLIVQYGAPMRQFNFSFSEAAVLLGKWEKEGVNTELVLGSLRIAIGKFAKEGIPLRQGLEDTITKIQQLGPSAQATALAMQTFGARAGADMAAAILEGRFAIEELLKTISDSGETIDAASKDIDGFAEQWDNLKNRVIAALGPLGTDLLKVLEDSVLPILQQGIEALGAVVGWFNELPAPLKNAAIAAAAVAAALGPLVLGAGAILPLLVSGLALLAGPAGIVVAVIAGLAALEASTGVISKAFRFVVDAVKAVIGVFTTIIKTVENLQRAFTEAGAKLIDNFVAGIKAAASRPVEAVKDMLGKIRNLLPFSPAKEGPLADLDDAGLSFSTTFASGIDAGRPFVTGTVRRLAEDAIGELEGMSVGEAFFHGFAEQARSAKGELQQFADTGRRVFEELRSGFSDILFEGIVDGVKGIERAFESMGKRILRIFTDLVAHWAFRQIAMMLFGGGTAFAGASGGGGDGGSFFGGGGFAGFFGSAIGSFFSSGGAGAAGTGGLFQTLGVGGLGQVFNGLTSMVTSWVFESVGSILSNATGELLPGAIGQLGNVGVGIVTNAAAWIGTLISVALDFSKGNIRGGSLTLGGAIIGTYIFPVIGTAIGALIGKLLDIVIGLFGPNTPGFDLAARIVPFALDKLGQQGTSWKDFVHVTTSARASLGIDDRAINEQVGQALKDLLQSLVKTIQDFGQQLPTALGTLITASIERFAASETTIVPLHRVRGDDALDVLKRELAGIGDEMVRAVAQGVFGFDLHLFQAEGETISEVFQALLTSMGLVSDVLVHLGTDMDAFVAGLGESDDAMRAFAEGSLSLFEQWRKDEEKLIDTVKRVGEAINGLLQLTVAIDAKISELTANTDQAVSIMVAQLARGAQGLVRLTDQLTVAIESGTQPEEILKLAKSLFDARMAQLDAEVKFVQQLQQEVQRLQTLVVSTIGAISTLSATIIEFGGSGTLFAPSGRPRGGSRRIEAIDFIIQEATRLFRSLAGFIVPQVQIIGGVFQSLSAILSAMSAQGASFGALAGVFNRAWETIKAGIVDALNTIRGLADPARAVEALQLLGQTVIDGFNAAIGVAQAYFDQQRSLAQEAAQAEIAAIEARRDAIQDSFDAQRQGLQDQRSLVEERFTIERDALNVQIDLTRQWRSILDSVETQLRDLFNLMAPTQPLTSLQTVQQQFRDAFAAFQAGPTPDLAEAVQTLAQQVIQLAQGVPGFDLPSLAFQGVVDEVTAALEAIKAVAEAQPDEQELLTQIAQIDQVQADTLASIDAQLAALDAAEQSALRGIDAQVAAVNADLQATLRSLSQQEQATVAFLQEQARAVLVDIRAQLVLRLQELQLQQEEAAIRLQEILGDKTFDEFIAGKQAETVVELQKLNALLADWFTRTFGVGVAAPTNATGFQHGTPYVPRTDLYRLHQGEMVLPEAMAGRVRRGEGGGEVTINLGGITVQVSGGRATDGKQIADQIEDALVQKIKGPSRLRPALQKLAKEV